MLLNVNFMFRAIHKTTGESVISIDSIWAERTDELRALDQQDLLLCRGCGSAVRLHAGKIRARYFAHKHLQNCSLDHVSPETLQVRAMLYMRLVEVFGSEVQIEKDWEHGRAIDCFVDLPSGSVAYWVVDRGIQPQERHVLMERLGEIAQHVHWVFTSTLYSPSFGNANALNLSTTERDLMSRSVFDKRLINGQAVTGHSLHYVDPETGIVTTHRHLHCVHPPQVFEGAIWRTPMADILIAPKNGEIVHPGERERLAEVQAVLARQKEQRRLADEEIERRRIAALQAVEEAQRKQAEQRAEIERTRVANVGALASNVGICKFCGQKTTDWYYRNGLTGECGCNACLRLGRAKSGG
ncbi:hypothetical protein CCAX7_25850 [Capsulimonas corticalis]|uniref:Competence protein CoiA-like N-terminal domain-containing protein n=1 Tax=Capsulimonas corticalis TaxID=2219043 RepID=A0A402CVU0_9BACT|nr:competence protein CoiA family protein [Capsulimonas corticalis]BDI30534.1 hypothetical protein CCAX7_25850 [Capsulimonas corticalis]